MTLSRATWAGILGLMLPSLALFLAPLLLADLAPTPAGRRIAAWLILPGFFLAWLVWSLLAPRWRLWALRNVTDATGPQIRAAAVKAGILWPAGHAWERTEIRGSNYAAAEASAELLGLLEQARHLAHDADADSWGTTIYIHLLEYIDTARTAVSTGASNNRWISNLAAEIVLHIRNDSLPPDPRSAVVFGQLLVLLTAARVTAAT